MTPAWPMARSKGKDRVPSQSLDFALQRSGEAVVQPLPMI